jgi:endonuclease/exonuclease/phosphatase (EEP) superfamily protein YafD
VVKRYTPVVALFSCIGLGADLAWPLELACHFRLQYTAAALVLFAISLRKKMWGWLTVSLAVFILNIVLVAPTIIPLPHPHKHNVPLVTVLFANVNSGNRQHQRLLDLLSSSAPDVVVLEEVTPSLEETLAPLKKTYKTFVAVSRTDNFGIALLSRLPTLATSLPSFGGSGMPSVEALLKVHAGQFRVIGTHPVPPIGATLAAYRNEHLQELSEYLARTREPTLLVGDLNCTPWSPHFQRMIAVSGFRSASSELGIYPSWPYPFLPMMIPLDHCLLSGDLEVWRREWPSSIGSDHLPITVTVGAVSWTGN